MRRKIYIVLWAMMPLWVMAGERSASEAAALAASFMYQQQMQSPVRMGGHDVSSFDLVHTRAKINSEAPAYYVFNKADHQGFVVVSADDKTKDILMYSTEGELDITDANPNLLFWLTRMQEQVSMASEADAIESSKTSQMAEVTAIAPLLKTKSGADILWDQEAPYYNQCPMVNTTRCLTGCVATAAAQVLCKWHHPQKGTGEHSYFSYDIKQTVSKDFSAVTFDWNNMLGQYTKDATAVQKAAVAELMLCCGVACEMNYNTQAAGGSGSWTDDLAHGLINYLGYKFVKFVSEDSKSGYVISKGVEPAADVPCEWSVTVDKLTSYFNTELEAGRPIIMGGADAKLGGGHEFVCDGRDVSGKFHINWGWSGKGNCYCELNALKPSSSTNDFSTSVDAILGLEPAYVDTVHVRAVVVTPDTLTLKKKQKQVLLAIVQPDTATVKDVVWTSSNEAIAKVNAMGQVQGLAQGEVWIIATSVDGGKSDTCRVRVTNEEIETEDCSKYIHTFTQKCVLGKDTLSGYVWTVTAEESRTRLGYVEGKGAQFGSETGVAVGVLSLTTDTMDECVVERVTVKACKDAKGDATLAVYIDGTQIGQSVGLTDVATDYVFTNTTGIQGDVEIRLSNSKKALYIHTIQINADPTEIVVPQAVKATNQATKVMLDGQLYIQYGGHIYNAQGQIVK